MPITRIVSGAQTGSDRGGLDAALHCGVPHGGFCPKGRRAEDGTIPDRYALVETPSKDYLVRTEANVVDSDATIIFTSGTLDGGSLKTAEFAKKHRKPWLHVNMAGQPRQQAVEAIVAWLLRDCPTECVLNVAGSRESKARGIETSVKAWMVDVISRVNGTLFYPIGNAPTADVHTDADNDDDSGDTDTLAALDAAPEPDGRPDHDHDADDSLSLYHPKSIGEAVQTLLNVLNPQTKDEIKANTDRAGFVLDQHFGLRLWIRNNLIHQNRNSIDLYADLQRGCRGGSWGGIADPDSLSGVVCGLVWDALHGR